MPLESSEPDHRNAALAGLRMDRPRPARMYDYFLGGKDNFQVDRDAADELDEAAGRGTTFTAAWENRGSSSGPSPAWPRAGSTSSLTSGPGFPPGAMSTRSPSGFGAVLHFVRDKDDPYGIVGTFRDVMAPGSYLVLSHVTTDGPAPELLARIELVYERSTSPSRPRSRDEIARFFDGLELLHPGLVRPGQWRPGSGQETVTHLMYAGVGTKTA